MMKFLVAVVLTALLAFVAGLYMPWWSLALAAFLVAALVHQRPVKAFFAGFTGLLLLWGGLAWWINMRNQSILADKMAQVLPVGGSVFLLITLTACIGALVAGMGALAGSYLRTSQL